MYRKILIPIDDSEASWQAAAAGLRLARFHGATAVGLAVIEYNPMFPPPLSMDSWAELYPELIAEGRARLQRLTRLAAELEVPLQAHLYYGSPAREILALAEQERPDLIVMAAHHGRLATLLLGSVSQEVLRQAACPVQIFGRGVAPAPAATEVVAGAGSADRG